MSLTDFLDLDTLQDIQDSFTAVTRVNANIRDAHGTPLTTPTDAELRAQSDQVLEQLLAADQDEQGRFVAPIMVEGQELGSIVLERGSSPRATPENREKFRQVARKLKLTDEQTDALLDAAEQTTGSNHAASIQFLYLMANSIARLCYEQYHARRRVEELSVLYKISTMLSAQRDLQQLLDAAASSVAEVMKVRAVSMRLVDRESGELVLRAVHGLSEDYLNKGVIKFARSEIFSQAMQGQPVYIEDMSSDDRILYPQAAKEEGLVSMFVSGIVYQDEPIGTLTMYTVERRRFTAFEARLARAIAQLLATAIENARLDNERMENRGMIRQLQLAADVQRRMLPHAMPNMKPFDIAARYVPSYELGGDFYDFIDLDGHLGIAVGDVVGKGVAASLLMASVRASLRAYAQDVYDLNTVISRVNIALSRDTLDNEFATLWYGVLDPQTLRLTYCNAGHEPPLLVRDGKLQPLATGGMIVGVDADQIYEKAIIDLRPNDMVLLYSDGLPDAFNANSERFGRKRIEMVLKQIHNASAGDALNHILWEMRRHTGLRRSVDDTTLVVIKVEADGTPETAAGAR